MNYGSRQKKEKMTLSRMHVQEKKKIYIIILIYRHCDYKVTFRSVLNKILNIIKFIPKSWKETALFSFVNLEQ